MAQPLKILCLHGYTQNAKSFSKKTAVFKKCLRDMADLVYITAPIVVPIPTSSSIEEREDDELENLAPEDKPYGWVKSQSYIGLDETLQLLRNTLDQQGPFDGIMGFSQGAMMASVLQLLLEKPNLSSFFKDCQHPAFKFSIIVAGFTPNNPILLDWYTQQYESDSMVEKSGKERGVVANVESTVGVLGPSLHVIGTSDVIIEPERSEGLLKHYTLTKPETLYHDGGHFMPSNAASRQSYKAFVQPFAEAAIRAAAVANTTAAANATTTAAATSAASVANNQS